MSLLIQILLMSLQPRLPSYEDCGYVIVDPAPPRPKRTPTLADRQRAAAKRLLCARIHFPDHLPELLNGDPEMAAADPRFSRTVRAEERRKMAMIKRHMPTNAIPFSKRVRREAISYMGTLPEDGTPLSVHATYVVQPDGRVTDCIIKKSSKVPSIDQGICSFIRDERAEPSRYSRVRKGEVSWSRPGMLNIIEH